MHERSAISHPFRITPHGHVATVDRASDQRKAEALGNLLMTRRGERALVPAYGTTDPAFGGPDVADIMAGVTLFGPDIEITDVQVEYPSPMVADVTVTFE